MNTQNKYIPPILQVEPSTDCNLDCPFCFRKKYSQKGENINFEVFKKAVDQQGFRYLSLHGWGEPLMNPYLVDMIKYGAEKGLSVNFTTNATLVGEKAETLLSSGVEIIAFSIPDLSLFSPNISGNIKYFHKLKKQKGLTFPKTYMNIAMMEYNFDTVEETLSISNDLGVDAVNFERSYPWKPEYTKEEETVFRKVNDFTEKTGLKITLPVPHTLPCRLFNTTLFMRYNGDVTPCCYRPDKIFGNINSETFDEIMHKRNIFREKMAEDPICSVCGI